LAKPKRKVSPAAAAQAEQMKRRLDELAAERREHDEAHARGEPLPSGEFAHGVDPRQIRSGRRGNR
jgi:hypothetical protein